MSNSFVPLGLSSGSSGLEGSGDIGRGATEVDAPGVVSGGDRREEIAIESHPLNVCVDRQQPLTIFGGFFCCNEGSDAGRRR